jgi:hypothetical protein
LSVGLFVNGPVEGFMGRERRFLLGFDAEDDESTTTSDVAELGRCFGVLCDRTLAFADLVGAM